MYNQFGIAVGALVLKGKKVLLLHRTDYDMWDLPSGGLEPNEDILQALKREIKEETGLKVEPKKLVGVYHNFITRVIVLLFTVRVISGHLTENSEADNFGYFHYQRLPKNTFPKQVERINDYFAQKIKPVIKVQKSIPSTKALKLHKKNKKY